MSAYSSTSFQLCSFMTFNKFSIFFLHPLMPVFVYTAYGIHNDRPRGCFGRARRENFAKISYSVILAVQSFIVSGFIESFLQLLLLSLLLLRKCKPGDRIRYPMSTKNKLSQYHLFVEYFLEYSGSFKHCFLLCVFHLYVDPYLANVLRQNFTHCT